MLFGGDGLVVLVAPFDFGAVRSVSSTDEGLCAARVQRGRVCTVPGILVADDAARRIARSSGTLCTRAVLGSRRGALSAPGAFALPRGGVALLGRIFRLLGACGALENRCALACLGILDRCGGAIAGRRGGRGRARIRSGRPLVCRRGGILRGSSRPGTGSPLSLCGRVALCALDGALAPSAGWHRRALGSLGRGNLRRSSIIGAIVGGRNLAFV